MTTNKFTAYGLTVAVAFAAAVVLLLASAPSSATADAGTTADAATTIDNAAAGTAVTITGTHVSGKPACDEGTFAVSAPVSGTAAAPVDAACVTRTTTIATVGLAADTTLTVASTTGFPTSGSLVIDNDGNANLASGAIEIVDYTGVTATSFTGVTRARAGTTALVPAVGGNVWPVVYTQTTIGATAALDTIFNVVDASALVAGGGAGGQLVLDPGGSGAGQEIVAAASISGNTVTSAALAGIHVPGEFVAQISGVNTDSATSLFTRTASTDTTGSFGFSLTANGQTSTVGTMSLTIIADAPVVVDSEVTAGVTLPTPLPVIIALTGSDSTEVAAGPAFAFTLLPTQGVLGAITGTACVNVTGAVAGEVLTNCSAQVIYTPLLGGSGTDSFQYTLTNGTEVSAAGTVTVILPGGAPTPTPGAGFGAPLDVGVTATTYGGGTVAQLETDASAAGATSVSVTSAGDFVVLIVGAPAFVNQAFNDLFPTGVPAGTVVIVLVTS